MKHFIAYIKDQSGVAATEFALIAPILILITVGTVDVGMYVNEKMKAENAARSAVDYVVSGGEETALLESVLADLYENDPDGIPGTADDTDWQNDVSVNVELQCECGDGVVVACTSTCEDPGTFKRRYYNGTVERTHNTLFPYPGFASTMTIEGHARMQLD